MKRVLAGVAMMLGLGLAAAGQTTGRTLEFSLDREGPPTVQYSLTVGESGQGTYRARAAGGPAAETSGVAGRPEPQAIRVSSGTVKKLFAAVPMVEGGRCETHAKGLAKTGAKTLRYAGAGREAQCLYNYSDDDRVNDATVAFEAIAETLRFGERLQAKLRFDRLGLDAELDQLQSAAAEGRALEVNNIAPVLRSISNDDRVMDRARRKAERLLEGVGPGQTAAGVDPSAR